MLFTAALVVYVIGLHPEYQNTGRRVCNNTVMGIDTAWIVILFIRDYCRCE